MAPAAQRKAVTAAPIALFIASAALGFAACFNPHYQNGTLACNSGRCPEGYYCAVSNTCWQEGTSPKGAGGAGPAPEDAGRDADGGSVEPIDGEIETTPPPPDADMPEPDLGPPDPGARLESLDVTPGTLEPAFAPAVDRYDLNLPLFTPNLHVKAVSANPMGVLSLNLGSLATHVLDGMVGLLPGERSLVTVGVAIPSGGHAFYKISVSTGASTFVKASVTQAGMRFGTAVAASGDWLVVGAPRERGAVGGVETGPPTSLPSDPETGAAFVYARLGGRWKYQATLKASAPQPDMHFGAVVAIAGDTIVVGAPDENGSATTINGPVDSRASAAGAAYVFLRTDAGWTQQAYLKASDGATGDQFGSSVAISTIGATPVTTIAVGAPGAGGPNRSPRTGNAYVFVRTESTGTWSQQASPRGQNPKGGNEFGAAIAVAGDTLVVSAPSEDSGASGVNPGSTSSTVGNSGAVFVFQRNGTTWGPPVYIKAPMPLTQAAFGQRVAVTPAFLAIAAPGDPAGGRGVDPAVGPQTGPQTGAVFLYKKNGNSWALVHHIKAGFPHMGDQFGTGLGLSTTTLAVGAPFEDGSGSLYVYRPGADGRWQELARVKAPNAERDDEFGNAVATEGDTVVAGADGEASSARDIDGNLADNAAPGSGAVYIY